MSVLNNPHPAVHTLDLASFDYAAYRFPDVAVSLDEGVLILTLNRPARCVHAWWMCGLEGTTSEGGAS